MTHVGLSKTGALSIRSNRDGALQAALALRRYIKTRHITAVAFLGAWLAAIALIANPGVSTSIAHTFGAVNGGAME